MKFIARRWGSRSFYCGCLFYSVLNFHRQHKTNLVAGFRCTPTHTHSVGMRAQRAVFRYIEKL